MRVDTAWTPSSLGLNHYFVRLFPSDRLDTGEVDVWSNFYRTRGLFILPKGCIQGSSGGPVAVAGTDRKSSIIGVVARGDIEHCWFTPVNAVYPKLLEALNKDFAQEK
jgi:hypothetical protein